MVYFQYPGDPEPRSLFVTADHLFMTPERQLIAVQYLAPNDHLLTAGGQLANVIFVAPGHLTTQIQSITMEGTFDGKNLDGHLLNANGLVTTDYKVQVYYESERLFHGLDFGRAKGQERARVGSPEYLKANPSAAYDTFLANPQAWPQGFEPVLKPLVNVPITAKSFLTQDQAEELSSGLDVSAPGAVGAQLILSTFQYLRSAGGEDVIYILDANNLLPNAYAFMRDRQRFVVFNAGLARVDGLYWEGMSLIAAAMRSYLREGIACVGESDYNAVAEELRLVWYNDLYIQAVNGGIEQMKHLFSFMKQTGGGGTDVCRNPSLACRTQTYENARMDAGIPDCAKPSPHSFELVSAVAENLETLWVTFNDAVEMTTGGTKENYRVLGGSAVEVLAAAVDTANEQVVKLSVTLLDPIARYLLVAQNVISQTQLPLDPKHDSAIVTVSHALVGARKPVGASR